MTAGLAIELAGMLITLISIWLATRENIGYYPTGIVAVCIYAWVFYDARLYAESLLQFVYLGLLVYGWYEWLHGGANRKELEVTRTPRRAWIAAICAGIAVSAVTIWIQRTYTDNPNPYVDSSLFAWSVVAQWMTARKWLENWILWAIVNTISVALYIVRDLWPTAALYAALWVLAILGYRQWRKTLV